MENLYNIAITEISGVGILRAKSLISTFGSAEAIFKESNKALLAVPFIGPSLANGVSDKKILRKAEQEINFADKYGIKVLFYKNADYPKRLLSCDDSPLILFYKGNADLNKDKSVAFVGTRSASSYGRGFCKDFIGKLKDRIPDVITVSGLAMGIDTEAHKSSLDNNIPTVGVLAHGLDRIYPPSNRDLAERMVANGGLITEFLSGSTPERENFPRRNRIVAGMTDATIVVESRLRGGSLITATIADSYNRDVFAVPGKSSDVLSSGCNWLIKNRRASMIESIDDFMKEMNWDEERAVKDDKQLKLFVSLTKEEEVIYNIIGDGKIVGIDDIVASSEITASKVAGLLLNLEFNDLIECLPGKMYKRV